MKYVQLPKLYPAFSLLSNTKWIMSETYLDENNSDSQICLLDCGSELAAKNIVEKTPLGRSLPGNKNNLMSLRVLDKYVFATKGLLKDFFAGVYVCIPDKKSEPLYYVSHNHHVIKLVINKELSETDEEENYLDSFWGAKKARVKTENPITAGYFYTDLYLDDFSHVLWLESGNYHGEKTVSAYGIKDKEEAATLQKIILQAAAKKGITIAFNNLGMEQNIVVMPLELLTRIFGQIRQVNLCNGYSKYGFNDESAEIRTQYIQSIFSKWDQVKPSDRNMNSTGTADSVLKNYYPVFFNPEASRSQVNKTITDSPSLSNFTIS